MTTVLLAGAAPVVRAAPATGGHSSGHTSSTTLIVFGVLLIAVGILNAAKPGFTYGMNRWQYKNKSAMEPSDTAILVSRLGGVVAIIAGVVILVMGISR